MMSQVSKGSTGTIEGKIFSRKQPQVWRVLLANKTNGKEKLPLLDVYRYLLSGSFCRRYFQYMMNDDVMM